MKHRDTGVPMSVKLERFKKRVDQEIKRQKKYGKR